MLSPYHPVARSHKRQGQVHSPDFHELAPHLSRKRSQDIHIILQGLTDSTLKVLAVLKQALRRIMLPESIV